MSNSVEFISIWKEENIEIKAVNINTRCPFLKFLKKLTETEKTKLYALFKLFNQQQGRIINNQKLRKLQFTCDGCFEFKPTKQIRISFVYLKTPSRHVCLLDGFKKKQDKWPKQEIKKTEKLCQIVKKAQR